MPVRYRDVPGLSGYRAGTDGSIWSIKQGRLKRLKDTPDTYGYLSYWLCVGGKSAHKFGHKMVLEAFVGPCPSGLECCHFDGNRQNNSLFNLRWDTRKANSADCIRHGHRPRGVEHGRAKLTEADVHKIRKLAEAGHSLHKLTKIFRVSTVRKIAARTLWKHI